MTLLQLIFHMGKNWQFDHFKYLQLSKTLIKVILHSVFLIMTIFQPVCNMDMYYFFLSPLNMINYSKL